VSAEGAESQINGFVGVAFDQNDALEVAHVQIPVVACRRDGAVRDEHGCIHLGRVVL